MLGALNRRMEAGHPWDIEEVSVTVENKLRQQKQFWRLVLLSNKNHLDLKMQWWLEKSACVQPQELMSLSAPIAGWFCHLHLWGNIARKPERIQHGKSVTSSSPANKWKWLEWVNDKHHKKQTLKLCSTLFLMISNQ